MIGSSCVSVSHLQYVHGVGRFASSSPSHRHLVGMSQCLSAGEYIPKRGLCRDDIESYQRMCFVADGARPFFFALPLACELILKSTHQSLTDTNMHTDHSITVTHPAFSVVSFPACLRRIACSIPAVSILSSADRNVRS